MTLQTLTVMVNLTINIAILVKTKIKILNKQGGKTKIVVYR